MDGVDIPWSALAWLALPLLLMGATSFTKISIVLSALRTGLGAEGLIPGAAMYTLGILLTALTMAPTAMESYAIATFELQGEVRAGLDLDWPTVQKIVMPLVDFARTHADSAEIDYVAQLGARGPEDPIVIALAFMLTELGEAFRAVVYLLLPFLLIDLVVAQLLAFVGTNMPLQSLTLPLKLLLFISVDGWHLLLSGLVGGYLG